MRRGITRGGHEQLFNVTYCDGHVATLSQSGLQLPWFYAQ